METYPGVKTMVDIENVESFAEYRQYINEWVDILIEEYDIKNDNDPYHTIGQNIGDSHAHMYYSNNMTVLKYSDNNPEEWHIYVEENETDYRKVLQAMAYATLQVDIQEEIHNRDIEL